mmetsp:Transcript_68290/g.211289  ORF Transcript_68290/g.211289 Transcript_68290/m.211289 type:complete len:215 (-) Transcript_68290:153-797(-)
MAVLVKVKNTFVEFGESPSVSSPSRSRSVGCTRDLHAPRPPHAGREEVAPPWSPEPAGTIVTSSTAAPDPVAHVVARLPPGYSLTLQHEGKAEQDHVPPAAPAGRQQLGGPSSRAAARAAPHHGCSPAAWRRGHCQPPTTPYGRGDPVRRGSRSGGSRRGSCRRACSSKDLRAAGARQGSLHPSLARRTAHLPVLPRHFLQLPAQRRSRQPEAA